MIESFETSFGKELEDFLLVLQALDVLKSKGQIGNNSQILKASASGISNRIKGACRNLEIPIKDITETNAVQIASTILAIHTGGKAKHALRTASNKALRNRTLHFKP